MTHKHTDKRVTTFQKHYFVLLHSLPDHNT